MKRKNGIFGSDSGLDKVRSSAPYNPRQRASALCKPMWVARELAPLPGLYREGLKNRLTGQGGSSDFLTGASDSAPEPSASEGKKYEAKPTPARTDFSITSGMKKQSPFPHPKRGVGRCDYQDA